MGVTQSVQDGRDKLIQAKGFSAYAADTMAGDYVLKVLPFQRTKAEPHEPNTHTLERDTHSKLIRSFIGMRIGRRDATAAEDSWTPEQILDHFVSVCDGSVWTRRRSPGDVTDAIVGAIMQYCASSVWTSDETLCGASIALAFIFEMHADLDHVYTSVMAQTDAPSPDDFKCGLSIPPVTLDHNGTHLSGEEVARASSRTTAICLTAYLVQCILGDDCGRILEILSRFSLFTVSGGGGSGSNKYSDAIFTRAIRSVPRRFLCRFAYARKRWDIVHLLTSVFFDGTSLHYCVSAAFSLGLLATSELTRAEFDERIDEIDRLVKDASRASSSSRSRSSSGGIDEPDTYFASIFDDCADYSEAYAPLLIGYEPETESGNFLFRMVLIGRPDIMCAVMARFPTLLYGYSSIDHLNIFQFMLAHFWLGYVDSSEYADKCEEAFIHIVRDMWANADSYERKTAFELVTELRNGHRAIKSGIHSKNRAEMRNALVFPTASCMAWIYLFARIAIYLAPDIVGVAIRKSIESVPEEERLWPVYYALSCAIGMQRPRPLSKWRMSKNVLGAHEYHNADTCYHVYNVTFGRITDPIEYDMKAVSIFASDIMPQGVAYELWAAIRMQMSIIAPPPRRSSVSRSSLAVPIPSTRSTVADTEEKKSQTTIATTAEVDRTVPSPRVSRVFDALLNEACSRSFDQHPPSSSSSIIPLSRDIMTQCIADEKHINASFMYVYECMLARQVQTVDPSSSVSGGVVNEKEEDDEEQEQEEEEPVSAIESTPVAAVAVVAVTTVEKQSDMLGAHGFSLVE